MRESTDIEAQVEYGLNAIDSDKKVEISLRDLLFVHQVLGEFIRFFHQPTHYPNLADVERFLGDAGQGGFHLLAQCYYEKLRDVFPPDVEAMFDDGRLEHPNPPYYYEPNNES